VNIGLCLPVFRASAGLALATADQAEAEGLDGVFSFDHLFPARQPHRPALSAIPILAAVAERTSRVRVGTLVSRVGVLEPGVQVTALATLQEMSAGRLIAGLGAGDNLSRPENTAYGLPTLPIDQRLALLTTLAQAVRARGIEVWIGGNSARMRDLAAAEADAWNCWGCPPAVLAQFAAGATRNTGCRPTWAGPPPDDGDLEGQLRALAAAGAGWAIYGPPPSTDWPAFVTKLAGAAKLLN
jgi:alkanesulfonate monooxygenase SsuD/methylene tetrahydromethanopterin reductase-like flavin-dependent oxidoreductase (luciferase family)